MPQRYHRSGLYGLCQMSLSISSYIERINKMTYLLKIHFTYIPLDSCPWCTRHVLWLLYLQRVLLLQCLCLSCSQGPLLLQIHLHISADQSAFYQWQCSSNVIEHRPISVCPLTMIFHIISIVQRVLISLHSNSPLAASRWLNLGHNSTSNLIIVSYSYTTVYQHQHTIVLSLLQGQTSMEKTLQPSTQDLATTHPYLTSGISASVALYSGNSALDKSFAATSD